MPKARTLASAPGVLVLICAVAALGSGWTISIPQAHLGEVFGFQNLLCWFAVVCAVGALVVEDRRAGIAFLLTGQASLLAWFGWAFWLVSGPAFAHLPWPFVGIDVVGPGWYAGGLAILIAAAAVVAGRVSNRQRSGGREVWLLAAIPGYGLARLDRWGRGLIWTLLFASALLLASYSSPDMSLFEQFRNYSSLPPAPSTRLPTWILLVTALVLWALSIVDTARIARSAGHPSRAVALNRH